MLTAISAGVALPIGRPIGAWNHAGISRSPTRRATLRGCRAGPGSPARAARGRPARQRRARGEWVMIAAKLVGPCAHDSGEVLVGQGDPLVGAVPAPDGEARALVDQDHPELQRDQQRGQRRAHVPGTDHVHQMGRPAAMPEASTRCRGALGPALHAVHGIASPADRPTTAPCGPRPGRRRPRRTPSEVARSSRGATTTTCDPPQIIPEASGAPCRCSIGTRCASTIPRAGPPRPGRRGRPPRLRRRSSPRVARRARPPSPPPVSPVSCPRLSATASRAHGMPDSSARGQRPPHVHLRHRCPDPRPADRGGG